MLTIHPSLHAGLKIRLKVGNIMIRIGMLLTINITYYDMQFYKVIILDRLENYRSHSITSSKIQSLCIRFVKANCAQFNVWFHVLPFLFLQDQAVFSEHLISKRLRGYCKNVDFSLNVWWSDRFLYYYNVKVFAIPNFKNIHIYINFIFLSKL